METLRCGSLTIFLRLVELFQDIDADANGTISFTEWISALLRVRKANYEVLDGYKKAAVNRACNTDSMFLNFHLASTVLGMKSLSVVRIGVSLLCLLLS